MATEDLPPDLAALEQELQSRRTAEPDPGLRRKVLASVRKKLHREPVPFGQFAAALAAAALLWINLSISVVNDTCWPAAPPVDPDRVEETARRIRALVPDLPENEVYRQALLAQIGSYPAPGPIPPSSLEPILRQKEQQTWGIP